MSDWPTHLPVRSVRMARHTNQFEAITTFYRDVIGLPEIGSFSGHDGYDGIMLGMPDGSYHLEFTSHPDGPPAAPPSRDNLLVFYIDDQDAIDALVRRLADHGHAPVEPENGYWATGGVTFDDPDGWGVVFMNMTERARILAEAGDTSDT
ncbi:MAG: VOC family protein [Chloroflexota bacterium]